MSEADFNLLRNMPVFGGLNNDTLKLIVDRSAVTKVAAGDCFFREGDSAESLFVLEQGVVAIERVWNGTTIVATEGTRPILTLACR